MDADFNSLSQAPFHITDSQGRRRSRGWRFGLAPAAAMALLGGLLWLAPWQKPHDARSTTPQATLAQTTLPQGALARGGDRTVEEAGKPAAIPGQVPEVAPNKAKQDLPSLALLTPSREATGSAPVTRPRPETQPVQEPVTPPEPSGATHEEHLDTQAMDKLLARLEPTDKAAVPTAPRAKAAKRKTPKSPPRVPANHRLPSSTMAPRRAEAVPARPAPALRFSGNPHTPMMSPRRAEVVSARPAPEFQFFRTDDPRLRGNNWAE